MAAVLHIATAALEVQVYTPHTQINEMMAFYRPDAWILYVLSLPTQSTQDYDFTLVRTNL